MEREDDAFHDRVEAGFLALAAADPDAVGRRRRRRRRSTTSPARVWAAVEPRLS